MPTGKQSRASLRHLIKLTPLLCLAALLSLSLFAPRTPVAAERFGTTSVTPAQQAALDRMNQYRAMVGVAPMRAHPALLRAAVGHANYYVLNFGHPSLTGMGLHTQQAGRPGYTAATMKDRIYGAGYNGYYNEGINLLGDPVAAVDSFMAMVNHRLPIIDPRYIDMGYGGNAEGRAKIDVFTYGGPGRGVWMPEFVGYPADGQRDVPARYTGTETNRAFPDAAYPVGTAITLKYTGPGALEPSGATIRPAGGQPLPLLMRGNYNYATANVVVVAARQPLLPGTTYEVRVEGKKNGAWFVQSWSFTTK